MVRLGALEVIIMIRMDALDGMALGMGCRSIKVMIFKVRLH